MKLTVVGLGLIGGSLALDLKASGFAGQVTGVERDPTHAETARARQLVDRILPLREALAEAGLIVLAMPVSAIEKLLPEVLDAAPPGATVTDMGSTKEVIAAAVDGHPRRPQYVASHPMAGTENSGPAAALHGLFLGKTAVLCDRERSAPAHLARVEGMYRALGMRLVYNSSGEHDRHVAYVSHLSHISSFVLANTVLAEEASAETIFDLAGGGFASTVRLAKSSPDMWAPIFAQNRAHVTAALDRYLAHLEDFRRALQAGDPARTRALMEDANRIRPVLERMQKGPPRGQTES